MPLRSSPHAHIDNAVAQKERNIPQPPSNPQPNLIATRLTNRQVQILAQLDEIEKLLLNLQHRIHILRQVTPPPFPGVDAASNVPPPNQLQSQITKPSKTATAAAVNHTKKGETNLSFVTDPSLPHSPPWGPSVWEEPSPEINAIITRLQQLARRVGFTESAAAMHRVTTQKAVIII